MTNLNVRPRDLLPPVPAFNDFIHQTTHHTNLRNTVEDEEDADPGHESLGLVGGDDQGGH